MGTLAKHDRRQVAAEVVAEERNQYLTFLLGDEMFAIAILNIKEILEYGSPTAVPMTPDYIRGVINLRGAVVPVVDLAVRFGRPPTAATRRTCIVIIEVDAAGEKQDVGMVVDAVSEVIEIASADIAPAPGFGTRIRSDFIAGMGQLNGQFVIVLGVDAVLALDDLAAPEPAGGAGLPLLAGP